MLFQVYKDNKLRLSTEQPSCVYDDEALKNLQNSGFKFKLNGKKATLKEVKSFRDNGI